MRFLEGQSFFKFLKNYSIFSKRSPFLKKKITWFFFFLKFRKLLILKIKKQNFWPFQKKKKKLHKHFSFLWDFRRSKVFLTLWKIIPFFQKISFKKKKNHLIFFFLKFRKLFILKKEKKIFLTFQNKKKEKSHLKSFFSFMRFWRSKKFSNKKKNYSIFFQKILF